MAWEVGEKKIDAAFDFIVSTRPVFRSRGSRSTDTLTAGSDYKLWTTVKVPHGFSLDEHCGLLAGKVGAERFRIMPRERNFHAWSWARPPETDRAGSRRYAPARMIEVRAVELREREWRVLLALKREFAPEEIRPTPWAARANEAGISLEEFYGVAEALNARKIIGRFSTFLEHVKPSAGGERVTRFNALFHWAVPPGREIEAGGEVGAINPHPLLLARRRPGVSQCEHHGRRARHRESATARAQSGDRRASRREAFPVSYTNVFWGGRSEIKPREISPMAYRDWLREMTPQAA